MLRHPRSPFMRSSITLVLAATFLLGLGLAAGIWIERTSSPVSAAERTAESSPDDPARLTLADDLSRIAADVRALRTDLADRREHDPRTLHPARPYTRDPSVAIEGGPAHLDPDKDLPPGDDLDDDLSPGDLAARDDLDAADDLDASPDPEHRSPAAALDPESLRHLTDRLATLEELLRTRLVTLHHAPVTQPLVLTRPTPDHAALTTLRTELETEDSPDTTTRRHLFWTYQDVLDRYGPPDKIDPTPSAVTWEYHLPDGGDTFEAVCFRFVDGQCVLTALD